MTSRGDPSSIMEPRPSGVIGCAEPHVLLRPTDNDGDVDKVLNVACQCLLLGRTITIEKVAMFG